MERKLKRLFDYQRFESNERIAEMIRSVDEKYKRTRRELSVEESEGVSAAGDVWSRLDHGKKPGEDF